MSITHNKKQIPLSNLLDNSISARSAPQIVSIKDECIFPFSNFPIVSLRNSTANSLFYMILFLTASSAVFLSKNVAKPIFDQSNIKCFIT